MPSLVPRCRSQIQNFHHGEKSKDIWVYTFLLVFTHDNVSSDLDLIFPQNLCFRKKEPVEILISTPMGCHGFNREEKSPVEGHGGAVPILVLQLCDLESQFTEFP